MILIAHRALFDGPDPQKENTIKQIELAIEAGFECEIDVRLIDNKFYLGHDTPDYEISKDFIFENSMNLWIHCKNLEALVCMNELKLNKAYSIEKPHYFWHQDDDYALTSEGFIWTFPGKPIANEDCIMVLPENNPNWRSEDLSDLPDCEGICSKFISEIKNRWNFD